MKPYNEKSKCPKCGSDAVSTEYVPAGLCGTPEGMRRACRCGYVWWESTLDTKVEREKHGCAGSEASP